MKYRFRAVERFWTSFYRLSPVHKESARQAWMIFKNDPFDPRLRAHKIQRLSAAYGRTIYTAEIESDLRLLFYLDGETVVSLIIGTHDIYKG
jgi:mRNA-degrading endonuclease YafQ of YafQ-DinJ toxin-antitoxin module